MQAPFLTNAQNSSSLSRMDVLTMTMAALLTRICADRGITLNQLAAYLGVAGSTMNRWVHGLSTPDPAYCWKIAERAGWPIEDVMRLAGHLPPAEPKGEEAIDPQVRERLERMTLTEQREFALKAIELAEALLREARKGSTEQ